MTFVIVNKDLDLSVGSTYGLIARRLRDRSSRRRFYDLGLAAPLIVICLLLGTVIGLLNGVLVTILQVPAFIATLTMLLIGRGIVLGLTGGKIDPLFGQGPRVPALLPSRRDQLRSASTTRSPSSLVVVAIGAFVLGQDPLGLRDLRHRRQRAGGDLCRHPTPTGCASAPISSRPCAPRSPA